MVSLINMEIVTLEQLLDVIKNQILKDLIDLKYWNPDSDYWRLDLDNVLWDHIKTKGINFSNELKTKCLNNDIFNPKSLIELILTKVTIVKNQDSIINQLETLVNDLWKKQAKQMQTLLINNLVSQTNHDHSNQNPVDMSSINQALKSGFKNIHQSIDKIKLSKWYHNFDKSTIKINTIEEYLKIYDYEMNPSWDPYCQWYRKNVIDVMTSKANFNDQSLLKTNYQFAPDLEAKLIKWVNKMFLTLPYRFVNFDFKQNFNLNQKVYLSIMLNNYHFYEQINHLEQQNQHINDVENSLKSCYERCYYCKDTSSDYCNNCQLSLKKINLHNNNKYSLSEQFEYLIRKNKQEIFSLKRQNSTSYWSSLATIDNYKSSNIFKI